MARVLPTAAPMIERLAMRIALPEACQEGKKPSGWVARSQKDRERGLKETVEG